MTTDIWAWVHQTHADLVEAGHYRLAEAVAEISGHAVNGRPDEVDAIFPEALATARALDLPWVEVYLRHWRLQSLVSERQQGVKALSEATSLLEFAHREETRECPQSVCVVQDFCICHARIDGPGYVRERLAILDETLPRIEPERNCFDCLTREYCAALDDDGRKEDALAHLLAGEAKHRAAGGDPSLSMHLKHADLLGELGRPAEGLTVLDKAEAAQRKKPYGLDEDDERSLAMQRAELHARLGDAEAALAQLLHIDEPQAHADLRLQWATTVELLVALGAFENSTAIGRAMNTWIAYLDEVGAHRRCLDLLVIAGRLAVARGSRAVALTLAGFGERKLADLRRTDGITEELAALRASAEALPATVLPVPVADIPGHLESLGTQNPDGSYRPADPEANLAILAAAHEAEPTDDHVVGLLSQYYTVLGLPGEAARLLWTRVEADPDDDGMASALGDVLLRARDEEGIARLAGLLAANNPTRSHWLRGNWAMSQGDWAEAARECAELVAIDDTVLNTRRMWAAAARRMGDFTTAQRLWAELFERADEEAEDPVLRAHPSDRWGMIIAATANRDWAAVREQCAVLDIDLDEPEGPIEEMWHPVDLRYDGPQGGIAVYSVRTGPATARVLTVTQRDAALNYGDVVVLDPESHDSPPEDEEEREGWYPTCSAVTLLEPGGFRSYLVDGAHPGEDELGAIVGALRERGWGVWVYTDDSYVLEPEIEGLGELQGVAFGVAVPPAVSSADADTVLTELTAGWRHPMSWLKLAEDAGADTARHEKITADYSL
ncbi:hypothetical protein Afil01_05050 [Actinorhabdospora filicis]|uniref:Tetratricopeptide repeat protein n=1 Tax=Actinorhabdospora filicis TaxID=1785913 RepID=A0A9W6W784_9ACTN|nr:hypothetical protein [Actinorhabdospora filicis]GLZ75698.1 hypothetical protein Afil01_05050 [Actinorhabdospora filicis]